MMSSHSKKPACVILALLDFSDSVMKEGYLVQIDKYSLMFDIVLKSLEARNPRKTLICMSYYMNIFWPIGYESVTSETF